MVILFSLLFVNFIYGQTAKAPDYGDGSPEHPYEIANLNNLYWITAPETEVPTPTQAQRWAANYKQTADIDFATASPAISTWNSNTGWMPIGYGPKPFSGTYDGQGYKINGLYILRPDYDCLGLFSMSSGSIMQNIRLTNVNINSVGERTDGGGGRNIGGLVGNATGTTISNSSSDGSVFGADFVGGLVGYSNLSTITNCNSSANVNGTNYVGGLVGENSSTPISNSYSSGSVSVPIVLIGEFICVGGLVGSNGSSTITNSYSSASVTALFNNYVGGLVGLNDGSTISNSYYCNYLGGELYGNNYVGGLVGYNNYSPISNSYSVSGVYSKGAYLGGLIGYNVVSTVTGCFWDAEFDLISTTTSGSNNYGAIGKTTEEMKTNSTFLGAEWDPSIWKIDAARNDGYPYLSWQYTDGTPLPVELTSFTASANNNKVELNWKTATEQNNYGFEIERATLGTTPGQDVWETLGFVSGAGNSNSPKEYSFIDTNPL